MLAKYFMGLSGAPKLIECDSFDHFLDQVSAREDVDSDSLRIVHDGCPVDDPVIFAALLNLSHSIPAFSVLFERVDASPQSQNMWDEVTPKHTAGVRRTIQESEDSDAPCASGTSSQESVLTSCVVQTPQGKLSKPKEVRAKVHGIKSRGNIMKEKLLEIIMGEEEGVLIMEHYEETHSLTDKQFGYILNLICRHINLKVTGAMVAEAKQQFAMGFVHLFPEYYDDTTYFGCGGIYSRETHTGKLEWRWKSFKKSARKGRKKIAKCGETPAKAAKIAAKVISPVAHRVSNLDEEAVDQDEEAKREQALKDQRNISWMKQNNGTDRRAEVERRYTETFGYRRDLLSDPAITAGDIIEQFPRILNIPRLISIDFAIKFPGQADALLENWTRIRKRAIELAQAKVEEKKPKGMEAILQQIREEGALQDENEPILKLLLALLPPQNAGTKRKASLGRAMTLLFDYQPVGTDIPRLLLDRVDEYKENEEKRSPYLLIIGTPAKFDAVFLVVDHHPIPSSVSLLNAVDELFKAHYTFGIEYQPELTNFLTFLQTAIFKIDADGSDPPSVKEIRLKFAV